MEKKLVICEKPSVAQSVARVLGAGKRQDGYLEGAGWVVSWCVGHLVNTAMPEAYDVRYKRWNKADLPILPEKWLYQVSAATKKQFQILKGLMKHADIGGIVNACDAGREGELIFRLVYEQCRCKKPMERLWISSMEDAAIRAGFDSLRPGTEYDALYEAALCRERADWIVGINATRLFSVLYGKTLHVGRVISPTLAMTVLREAEIDGFVPEAFYTVTINLPKVTATGERIKEQIKAAAVADACSFAVAVVTKCERKEKSEKAPALYDLTSLQRDANRLLGFTAQQTLDFTQSLYEKKLVTYPRTDSRYLTDDMEAKVPALVEIAAQLLGIAAPATCHSKNVIENKRVSDHHAIVLTGEAAHCHPATLPAGERAILQLIATRLAASVAEPYRYAETVAEFRCGDALFTAKGKTVLDAGWKAIEKPGKAEKDTPLPAMAVGDAFSVLSTEVKQGKTAPPKHFTEDTLLSAMERAGAEEMPAEAERKGIGTPATRAAIIERLVDRGFLKRVGDKKSKHLIPTGTGRALITVLPEELQSAALTVEWEEKLLLIEQGAYEADAFMAEIEEMITELVRDYRVRPAASVFLKKNPKEEH